MTRPIRVALETQFADVQPTGIGVYARRLADALAARGDVDVVELRDQRFDVWRFDRRIFWDQVRAPSLARSAQADVFHFTGGTLPLWPPRPVVLTLHDLVWLRGANRGRAYVRWYFGRLQSRLARRADALVVDAESARADVAQGIGIDPSRIVVAGVGVDESLFNVRRAPVDPPMLLAVGTVEERKRLAFAVEALAKIPGARLVAAGLKTPYAAQVIDAADRLGVRDRIELRGYVDRDELLRLYAAASALVFTSVYEGFGLPLAEALACGLPVAATRAPVTEEVTGNCAWLVARGDAEALAAAIGEILRGGDAVARQIARGRDRAATMRWGRVAERLVTVYRSLADADPEERRGRCG